MEFGAGIWFQFSWKHKRIHTNLLGPFSCKSQTLTQLSLCLWPSIEEATMASGTRASGWNIGRRAWRKPKSWNSLMFSAPKHKETAQPYIQTYVDTYSSRHSIRFHCILLHQFTSAFAGHDISFYITLHCITSYEITWHDIRYLPTYLNDIFHTISQMKGCKIRVNKIMNCSCCVSGHGKSIPSIKRCECTWPS